MENSNLNDLLRRIKDKDIKALEELYSVMKNCVYGLAFTYTKSHSDSEDIVQDTFLNIWEKCSHYKENNPKAWIMTITKNLAKN
ncbi:MAG: RNA polymerase sigma factor, partial [Oscillospiraceae bacterium]|nr:RNA polymerase sigma factor [Oscillospiraceae bacterium]